MFDNKFKDTIKKPDVQLSFMWGLVLGIITGVLLCLK